MSDIAIFGGGFDPITLHHERIAEMVYAKTGMPVWTMPCFGHKFSKNSILSPPEQRLDMVHATSKYYRDILVPFDWEIRHRHSGSMHETIQQLKAAYPEHLFHLVVGMDNANHIEEKWHKGKELIAGNPFIVFGRSGVAPTASWFMSPPHRFFEIDSDGSSTKVREAIERGDYVYARQHVSTAVWCYIIRSFMYGFNQTDIKEILSE